MHEYHEFFCLVLKICEEICRRMEGNKDLRIPDRIVFIFFTKATHTLKAIGILYENTLPEEAQSLVRVLLETNINFCMFLLMLTDDPMSAVMRLLDAMILEKLKQQRASNFAGLELVPNGSTPEDFFNAEKEIASRYSEKD